MLSKLSNCLEDSRYLWCFWHFLESLWNSLTLPLHWIVFARECVPVLNNLYKCSIVLTYHRNIKSCLPMQTLEQIDAPKNLKLQGQCSKCSMVLCSNICSTNKILMLMALVKCSENTSQKAKVLQKLSKVFKNSNSFQNFKVLQCLLQHVKNFPLHGIVTKIHIQTRDNCLVHLQIHKFLTINNICERIAFAKFWRHFMKHHYSLFDLLSNKHEQCSWTLQSTMFSEHFSSIQHTANRYNL